MDFKSCFVTVLAICLQSHTYNVTESTPISTEATKPSTVGLTSTEARPASTTSTKETTESTSTEETTVPTTSTGETTVLTTPTEETAVPTTSTGETTVFITPTEETAVPKQSTRQTTVLTTSTEKMSVSTTRTEGTALSTIPTERKTVPTTSAEVTTESTSTGETTVSTIPTEGTTVSTTYIKETTVSTRRTEGTTVSTIYTEATNVLTTSTERPTESIPTKETTLSTTPTEGKTVPTTSAEGTKVPITATEATTVQKIPTEKTTVQNAPTERTKVQDTPIERTTVPATTTGRTVPATNTGRTVQATTTGRTTLPETTSGRTTMPATTTGKTTMPATTTGRTTVTATTTGKTTVPATTTGRTTVPATATGRTTVTATTTGRTTGSITSTERTAESSQSSQGSTESNPSLTTTTTTKRPMITEKPNIYVTVTIVYSLFFMGTFANSWDPNELKVPLRRELEKGYNGTILGFSGVAVIDVSSELEAIVKLQSNPYEKNPSFDIEELTQNYNESTAKILDTLAEAINGTNDPTEATIDGLNRTKTLNYANAAAQSAFEQYTVCSLGYQLSGNDTCIHDCDTDNCLNGGVCIFDSLRKKKQCRCIDTDFYAYSGDKCENKSMQTTYTIGITAAIGSALVIIIVLLCCLQIRKSKKGVKDIEYNVKTTTEPHDTIGFKSTGLLTNEKTPSTFLETPTYDFNNTCSRRYTMITGDEGHSEHFILSMRWFFILHRCRKLTFHFTSFMPCETYMYSPTQYGHNSEQKKSDNSFNNKAYCSDEYAIKRPKIRTDVDPMYGDLGRSLAYRPNYLLGNSGI